MIRHLANKLYTSFDLRPKFIGIKKKTLHTMTSIFQKLILYNLV